MFFNSINSRFFYFKFFMISSVLMPLFPSLLNRSQMHINIYMAALSVLSLFLFRFNFRNLNFFKILVFYFSLQVLLILSYLFGIETPAGLSDVMSLVRPFLLFLLTSAFYVLSVNEPGGFYIRASKIFSFLVVLSFVVGVIEIVRPPFLIDLVFFIFKISDKVDIMNSSVGFFALPYYNSFFYISSLIIILFVSLHTKFTFYSIVSLFCGVLGVVFTQSKTGVLALLVILFFSLYLKFNKFYRNLFFIFFTLSFLILLQFLGDILIYLNNNYSGNLIRTSFNIYHNQQDTNTLGVRILQIFDSLGLILGNNIFWGLGLGKEVLLESWLSTSLYRYGIFGTLLLFTLPFCIILKHFLKVNYKVNKLNGAKKDFLIYIFPVWLISCFITQLSALMVEVSKGALIGSLMIGLGMAYSSYYFSSTNRVCYEKSIIC